MAYLDEYSYKIPEKLFYNKFNIHIYYKNMNIKWILEEFSSQEINKIAGKILESTTNVKFNHITKNFSCKNKFGLKVVEKVLMQHYFEKRNTHFLPDNIIEQSLYNFASNNDEWQNLIV